MTGKNHSPEQNPEIPKLSEGQLEPLFRRLNLAHTRRIYQQVVDRAEKESWSCRDFLGLLLAEEVAHRKQTRLQRLTRSAHFPFFKTIDEFDFSLQSALRQALLGSYLGPDFVTEGRSLILYGKTGRGKTHLALPRHPERLRNLLHQCRKADRRSLQCQQEGAIARVAGDLHPPPRFDRR
jgi:hypothetical protein